MQLGWKSITGAFMVGIGWMLKTLSAFYPFLEIIGEMMIGAGIALGGYGFRTAIAKVDQHIVEKESKT